MNRREFVRGSLLVCASSPLVLRAFGQSERRIFFRLECGSDGSVLRSFVLGGASNATVDSLALPPTTRLVEHPYLPVLYGLLSIDRWDHRPRAAVCSVRYSAATGKFLSHSMTPLSLGAVGIAGAEVDRNGEQLMIVTSTGIRNVFRLNERGEAGLLVSVRKSLSPLLHKGSIKI